MLTQNFSLKNLNTFGVDVYAKLFAEIFSEQELVQLLYDEKIKYEKKLILGGGSNILFTKDFDGLIIKVSQSDINVLEENNDSVLIEVGAGINWDDRS
ncbi:MAG: UDP-N-acetylenolpyruvoylglucosamine reductase, partial [Ignavibacteria bacterium]|nr:UDP-N-acetylenolpyruvoylglucosamine reductase [Ignavibacteria bacterium]